MYNYYIFRNIDNLQIEKLVKYAFNILSCVSIMQVFPVVSCYNVRQNICFKEATKSYSAHYSYFAIILFNVGLCWSAFSTTPFGKLVFCLSVLSVLFVLNQTF